LYITVSFIPEVRQILKQVIYKIINLVNDKFYVGSTANQHERFRTHRKKLRRGVHHCKHLQAAWNKYGEEKFLFKVIAYIPEGESLQEAEDRWLKEHHGKEYCYNSGRLSGAPWRGVPKEAHPSFGVPKTEKHRQQISTALKEFYAADYSNHPRVGTRHTEETKAKISASKKANPSRYWEGKERSEETKAKISVAQKGIAKAPRTYTPEGLESARRNMLQNSKEQAPLPFEAVLAKFPEDVRAKYDFSKAIYTGALERITGCVCPEHGEFSQYAARFRKGAGCPQCGAVARAVSKKKQMLKSWGTEEGREMFMGPRSKKEAVAP